ARRTELAQYYLERLATVDELLPLAMPAWEQRHAWHLFIVRLDIDRAGISRNSFMAELQKKNIGTGIHFRAVHEQKYYRETLKLLPGALPATEWNSERICSLPLFPAMTMDDVDDVVAAIKEVLAR
ncbi:MAG: UDP-4-amino-4-deoxy-L-arabinose--oxoglutarate aminotransferase, partial [Proteobacteria bacterium]|nr:UDP-4-amino-4-deoxy-L-arabinose--oxoglutarate aminotransferase [Pseudomonadota bacterium]